jgi:outer membrane protein assembly factor BamE (lipoprotein component of BamABCDE complex)
MVRTATRTGMAVVLSAIALMSSGCARVPGHQGFISDSTLVESIQAGVDNRDSVEKTLGRPTFVSQFGQQDWYYVARETKQLAFAVPTAVQQTVLRVRFDTAGNVAGVDKAGMEKVARISPNGDKTPTLGRDRSFFEDLFGNIGTVGAVGESGGTADNPN